jgi:hypothetical protein
MSMKVYDADQVSIIVGGILIDSGFADGEFLRIEQEGDDFTDLVGTDGQVVRSKSNDRRATATVLLSQTSEGNQALSALSNLDRSTPNGAGIVPFLVRDRQGASIYTSEECWIMKPPDVSFDREATVREWTIRLANLVRNDAGT